MPDSHTSDDFPQFSYLTQEQRDRLKPKLQMLRGVKRKAIIWLLDYDLTMASKDNPDNFDDAPLKQLNYKLLCDASREIGRIIVSTARGNSNVLDYLKDPLLVRRYGLIQNVFLASNSGHYAYGDITCSGAKLKKIPIKGYENNDPPLRDVLDAIDEMVTKLGEYKETRINPNHRECCGAVTFDKMKTVEEYDAFVKYAEELRSRLPDKISKKIYFSSKPQINRDKDGNILNVQGYIDLKPVGMDKGYTTEVILLDPDFGILTPDSVIIVAGDSASDYPMMQKAADLVRRGLARDVVCIDVGGGITCDEKGVNHDTEGLVNVVLKSTKQYPAIDQLYMLLEDMKNICPAPENASTPTSHNRSFSESSNGSHFKTTIPSMRKRNVRRKTLSRQLIP